MYRKIKTRRRLKMKIPSRKDLTKENWIKAEKWFNKLNPQEQLENIMDLYYNKVMLNPNKKVK